MQDEHYPDSQRAERLLKPLLDVMAHVFRRATRDAKDGFTGSGLTISQETSMVFSGLVRGSVRKQLVLLGGFIVDENGEELIVKRPFNLGIWLRFGGIEMRAYKESSGSFKKGRSTTFDRFVCQLPPLQDQLFEDVQLPVKPVEGEPPHLIALWSVNDLGDLRSLTIVLPLGWDEDDRIVEGWRLPLNVDATLGGDVTSWRIADSDGGLDMKRKDASDRATVDEDEEDPE